MLTKEQVNKIKKELSDEIDRMFVICRALGDQSRFRMFRLLMKHHDLCVTDIAHILNITVSAASQQLRVLEMLKLVAKMRMGQMICYELNNDNLLVKQLIHFVNKVEHINH